MTATTLLDHEIPAAAAWSAQLRRGRLITLTALADGVNCGMLLLAATDPVDRLNVPDTLKAQMSACVRAPMVLMSDRGVGLCSVVGSSMDWHDCITGHSLDAHVRRWGPSCYQDDHNDWRRSARHGLLSELRKHGRDAADLHGCVNFFSKVKPADDEAGTLSFQTGHSRTGDWVRLRTEQDVLVVFCTAPHAMDPQWRPGAVRVEVTEAAPYDEQDPSWTFRDESARALRAAQGVFA